MRKIIIIGGGAAVMFAAFRQQMNIQKFIYMNIMRSLERSCLSQERDAAILPMAVMMWKNCWRMWSQTPDFCIRHFIHSVIRI